MARPVQAERQLGITRDPRSPELRPLTEITCPGHELPTEFELADLPRRQRSEDRMRATGNAAINAINPANPCHWVTIYCDVDDVIDETDSERGHLATESIDRLAELYLDADVHPMRLEGEQRALFVLRPTKIVTFGTP